ncbi:hypothetical protein R3P38DRAFT_2506672 [Favolaschia claudopus]|uniref:DUF6699 domain-containing protein n=1 Tax=Favolaschia claudopus TaxID=2862362 RepID=A0AAW0D1S0_9AGAR
MHLRISAHPGAATTYSSTPSSTRCNPGLPGLFKYNNLGQFQAGLRWERSPYACVPLPDISSLPPITTSPIHPDFSFSTVRAQPAPIPMMPKSKSVPLPAQVSGITEVALHPALRFGCRDTLIKMDFGLDLDDSDSVDARALELEETATFPRLPSLTLICSRLPWVIIVHARGDWVTVGDVLVTIRRALEIPLTAKDVEEWMRSRKFGKTQTLKRHGLESMTRMDLLEGRTVFAGLSTSAMGCEIWEMHFS